MTVHAESGATYVSLEFESDEHSGRLVIRAFPSPTVTDRLLFV
ncbi:hypothetical protein OG985_18145 [Streptomyces sp. NBC_00289]